MISVRGLSKRYEATWAVQDLTFEVRSGLVTGFLGPNGAGKSTTMRMILGLDHPTAGSALFTGLSYRELPAPLHTVGAVLDARAVHPGRSVRQHLLALARFGGIPCRRVEEVIGIVGLETVAGRRAGALSLGMSQRLGIAGALLGDPEVLLFDEPVNGLDVDGVRWARGLMRSLADEGRTVFVSSHLLSEMRQTADRLLVIGRGRLLADTGVEEFLAHSGQAAVILCSPDETGLTAVQARLAGTTARVHRATPAELVVEGTSVEAVGDVAHGCGLRVHGLQARTASLEQAYLTLTASSVEYAADTSPGVGAGAARGIEGVR